MMEKLGDKSLPKLPFFRKFRLFYFWSLENYPGPKLTLLASLHFKYQHNDSAIMAGLTPGKAVPAAFQKEATRIKTALLQRY